ncbi:MAG: hypothetical protein A6D91_08790 [Bacillaceae bacterium G1]|nr:hypothetical protein [Bacillota bacterium]OJF17059.1 MAG: hypothetical protein A6D91_08790 [Bacillaceae bacterium G1]
MMVWYFFIWFSMLGSALGVTVVFLLARRLPNGMSTVILDFGYHHRDAAKRVVTGAFDVFSSVAKHQFLV